jgi:NAD(P)-dependent dehydrogenase (short-subunit alcohol dehydrogenase family)
MELKPFGVQVVDLRPGDIRTTFNESVPRAAGSNSPYQRWAECAWQESCRLIDHAPQPELIAQAILRLLQQRKPPAMKRCGSFFQADVGALGMRLLSRTALLDSIRSYYGLARLDNHHD